MAHTMTQPELLKSQPNPKSEDVAHIEFVHRLSPGRVHLRVKLKSLAEEARMIRLEERRAKASKKPHLRNALYRHRIDVVRPASRYACLAAAFLRGTPYRMAEANPRVDASFDVLIGEVKRFGSEIAHDRNESWQDMTHRMRSIDRDLRRWLAEPRPKSVGA